jgi:hypothetical protein
MGNCNKNAYQIKINLLAGTDVLGAWLHTDEIVERGAALVNPEKIINLNHIYTLYSLEGKKTQRNVTKIKWKHDCSQSLTFAFKTPVELFSQ